VCADNCLLTISARRGRRYPLGAHAVAVSASLRLHCDARPGVASHNSLRFLRSLRSNRCDESDNEARCARRPQSCASRRHRNRPHRAPPAAMQRSLCSLRRQRASQQRRVRAGRGAPLRRREAQGLRPRAQRPSTSDSPRLFERSERSERSELCGGPQDRASQGSRSEAQTASAKCPGLPGRAFAALNRTQEKTRRTTRLSS